MGIEMFKEILNFPLRSNPFFAKIISLGDNFQADGIEDGEADNSGYVCQHLGNLDCQDGFKPQCSGLGVIDCAGECAGTEDEFKHFMDVMEDKEFDQKFPELAKVKKSQEKVKPSMPAEDKMEEVPSEGDEMEEEEEKDSVKTKFMNGLMKCANFSQETMALLSLANPGAGGGIGDQDTSDPNSKVYVNPDALSEISEVEYDYSDLYDYDDDDEVEEAGKNRRDTTTHTTTTEKAKKMEPLKLDPEIKAKKMAVQSEKEMAWHKKGMDKEEMSEAEKISMNVIRSAGDESAEETTTMSPSSSTMLEATSMKSEATTECPGCPERTKPLEEEDTELIVDELYDNDNGTAVNETEAKEKQSTSKEERIKRELSNLRTLFEDTVTALKQPSKQALANPVVYRLARAMRTKREMEDTSMTMSMPDPDACVVKNMTCVKFPSRKHCTGIALGRCGSRTELLVALFTPHVVMVTIVSVFVFFIVTIGLSYYCYRLKSENKIAPTETGLVTDEVKKVEPAPDC